MEKELMICHQIKSIERSTNRKSARMTIEFNFPPYLKCSKDMADDLIDKLINQSMSFDDIKIKGLSLKWSEDKEKT